MNDARIHLALVHLPIAGLAIAVLFLLLAEITRKDWLGKGGAFLLVLTALSAWGAYATGEGAEDVLGGYQGSDVGDARDWVHVHERRAWWAFLLAIVAGVGGAYSLFASRKKDVRAALPVRLVVLLLALAATFATLITASAGGEIRHAEIREPGAKPNNPK
jgi:drug/metabolite transporter (DMT)-like permease